ncbi:uncharacterized protein Z519_09580 [Cladophialophora bantiana CBS 173.52]|uniref:Uncharacterized protein n=1 Tax=Cladophialophora bantiana (strain ATCC 10958 / CBS 173.52 / CDC B-1940 / NIH 8579) TaxID=1442370 RepID=A0A0D2HA82_CLAB1|nr:uncharacterized protein Z519_09580 [Cladophialophora bantiana CBS 173.52]KIW90148.1 hypothetical protein Z519_09580 [Cladophialophora bantiana CBS 173.52]
MADRTSSALVADVLKLIKNNILLFFVLFILSRCIYGRYFHQLSKYPDPLACSCTRLWKAWSEYNGHTELDYIDLHGKYGSTVRAAPNELSFTTPKAAHDVLTPGNSSTRTELYKVFPQNMHQISSQNREWEHAAMKRVAVFPYSLASMQKMGPWIKDVSTEFIAKIDEYADSGRVCDLVDLLHYFSFDYDSIVGQVPELRHVLGESLVFQYLLTLLSLHKAIKWLWLKLRKEKMNQTDRFFLDPDRRDLLGQLIVLKTHGNSKRWTSSQSLMVRYK